MSSASQTILVLAALAIVIAFIGQTVALFYIYGIVKKLDAKVADTQARLIPLITQSSQALTRPHVLSMKSRLRSELVWQP